MQIAFIDPKDRLPAHLRGYGDLISSFKAIIGGVVMWYGHCRPSGGVVWLETTVSREDFLLLQADRERRGLPPARINPGWL
jgi:hypothetical protein